MKPLKEDFLKDYPEILTAKHVSEILGVCYRHAYEIMEWYEFPLIRIGRNKKVRKDSFIKWLDAKEREHQEKGTRHGWLGK